MMGDRKVQIRVSKDGGYNYGAEREKSLGEKGQYGKRVRFSNFGDSLQMDLEIVVTSPCGSDLMGATADIETVSE